MGKPLSEEHKRKISEARKGKPLSDEHRRKLSEAHKGQQPSAKALERAAESNRGRAPWNKGKQMSEATREKMRQKTVSPETRAKISAAMSGKPHSAEHNAKVSTAQKGKVIPPEQRAKIANTLRGRTLPEVTRRKISDALKGKPGHPVSDEHKEKLRQAHLGKPLPHTPEWDAHIAQALTGRTLSPEHRAATSRGHMGQEPWNRGVSLSDETRQRISEANRRRWAKIPQAERVKLIPEFHQAGLRAAHRTKRSRIELAIEAQLVALGVEFDSQYELGKYHADFYLPAWNVILECDGAYWHSLPKAQARDRERDAWMRTQGYRILRLGEWDIRADAFAALQTGLQTLNIWIDRKEADRGRDHIVDGNANRSAVGPPDPGGAGEVAGGTL